MVIGYFTMIILYSQFATLVVLSITYALFFGFVVFTSVVLFIGPQKRFGDLKYYVYKPARNWVRNWCFRMHHR